MTPEYYGAILLLKLVPEADRAAQIAQSVAQDYFPDGPYSYEITDTLPEGTPVDVYDQYTAAVRDMPEGAAYMLIYPVEESQLST